jgi:UDP-GlcNAc:undecaprenyl-phosphate GlcNAc-1-phosphate transferase
MSAVHFGVVFVISFFITYSLIPWLISFSIKRKLYDDPKGDELKVHEIPIPYLGGIGIFIGFIIPFLFFFRIYEDTQKLWGILIGGILIIILGMWDDMKNISPFIRLSWQLLVVLITLYLGVRIGTFSSYYLTIPITIVYILGSINSLNLIDGLDGLAGGVISISLIGFCLLFYFQGKHVYSVISLGILGSILGFLPYNFSPAKIFLGDNGSTFLGYMIAILAVNASTKPYDLTSFFVPLFLIGLPIIDTTSAILRRLLKRRPLFGGDRSHIYDWLVSKGFSVKKTVLICYSMQALLVSGGLILFRFGE